MISTCRRPGRGRPALLLAALAVPLLGPATAPAETISGVVFEDADFAGTASAYDGGVGDVALAGVDVELYDAESSDQYLQSTTTDSLGAFSFNASDQLYKVRVRTATIGDADTPPAGGLHSNVPTTWPYPVPEMTWADGAAAYGGGSPIVDDTATGDDAGPGDAWVFVDTGAGNVTGLEFGFAYNLVVNTLDDTSADDETSQQGSLRQFLKNANAIRNGTAADSSQFRMQVAANQSSGADSWWRITPLAALPAIADSGAVLDGGTQTANGGDTNSLGPEMEIYGASLDANGLTLSSGKSTIRGLVVNGFDQSFRAGILVSGAAATRNTVAANYVGTNHAGTAPVPNYYGVRIAGGATVNLVGGTAAADRNVLSGNDEEGLVITGLGTDGNQVQGNYVGLTPSGTVRLQNSNDGIEIASGARSNTIGGTTAGHRNVISGNSLQGVSVSSAHDNVIRGNYIGTNATGTGSIWNLRGVWISGGSTGTIAGGSAVGARNVISGNSAWGIVIGHAGTDGTVVQGNYIGTEPDGLSPRANGGPGIEIQFGATNSTIGGMNVGEGNLIARNTGDGIYISSSSPTGHVILGNSIYTNGGLAVDLEPDGVGTGGGANNDKASPVINGVAPSGADFTVAVTCAAADTIDLYRATNGSGPAVTADATGYGESYLWLGSVVDGGASSGPHVSGADADSLTGHVLVTVLASGLQGGDEVSATATDGTNGTSELALNVAAAAMFTISGTVFEDVNFTGTPQDVDGGDFALQNAEVELYDADGGDAYVASDTTDVAGAYGFTGLSNGNYKVRIRSATIADADTPPSAGRNGTVPGTWTFPLPEMVWGNGALLGGQDPRVDDTVTGDDLGPGDTYAAVTVSGGDLPAVNFGFSYELVVNTLDDGALNTAASDQGSLRQYLKNANGLVDRRVSRFQIPTTDPGHSTAPLAYTIAPVAALPSIDYPTVLDGTTQPGFTSFPVIVLDGVSAGAGADGVFLDAGADASVVRGLRIVRFTRDGVSIAAGADSVTVAGNWIGSDGTGASAMGNDDDGIDLLGAYAVIGGTGAGDRNIINHSGDEGINITGSSATGSTILGNFIGLESDGTSGSGNTDVGIAILTGATHTTIGGTTAAARNLISMNFEGIEVNTDSNTVIGNYIGTDSIGTGNRGNRNDDGVEIQSGGSGNRIGGVEAGAGNVIAFNQRHGVTVKAGANNAVIGNRIHANVLRGIDLGDDGVTPNDGGDGDTGPNELLNFPVVTSATAGSGTVDVDFDLDTAAGRYYRIEFFKNPGGQDPLGYGEGEVFADSIVVNRVGAGPQSFSTSLAGAVGDTLTATCTVCADGATCAEFGPTSEFSAAVTVAAGAPLAIVKRAFQINGTPVASGVNAAKGAHIKYLIYVNNPGAAVTDVSVRDALDSAFVYQPGTIRFDNGVAGCAGPNCTPAEEAAIFAAADGGTQGTDLVDADIVSVTGVTVDAGNQNAGNGQLDLAANRVWAVVFTVKVD